MIDQRIKDLKANYRKCFQSEDGAKVLKDLLRFCLCDVPTFNSDALVMAYNEGVRSVALFIKRMMEDAPTETEETE